MGHVQKKENIFESVFAIKAIAGLFIQRSRSLHHLDSDSIVKAALEL
jgi:hypothetical protein